MATEHGGARLATARQVPGPRRATRGVCDPEPSLCLLTPDWSGLRSSRAAAAPVLPGHQPVPSRRQESPRLHGDRVERFKTFSSQRDAETWAIGSVLGPLREAVTVPLKDRRRERKSRQDFLTEHPRACGASAVVLAPSRATLGSQVLCLRTRGTERVLRIGGR